MCEFSIIVEKINKYIYTKILMNVNDVVKNDGFLLNVKKIEKFLKEFNTLNSTNE